MQVLIVGATGLTGSELLKCMLEDSLVTKVFVIARSEPTVFHPRLRWMKNDFKSLMTTLPSDVRDVDELYCCIGTTRALTPDKQEYRAIDYGIPVQLSHWGVQSGVKKFGVISAPGAHVRSCFFYNKTKGEMEREVCASGLPGVYIFRPGLITGNRKDRRPMEHLLGRWMDGLSWLIPRHWRPISGQQLSAAMRHCLRNDQTLGQHWFDTKAIAEAVDAAGKG
jgi:uncharacterized protein YbjT (DUF2867 family)